MKNLFLLIPTVLCVAQAESCAAPTEALTTFTRAFAPEEGMVKAPEKPYRQELCLNGRWQFQPMPIPANYQRDTGTPPNLPLPSAANWETTPLKVPSPWNVNTWGNGRNVGAGTDRPYTTDSVYFPSYPASWDGVEMGWLKRSFRVPADWGNRRVVLHFEGVAGEAQVRVNGQLVGMHFDTFLPFDFDVTSLIKQGADNELLVGIRKSNLFNKVSPDYPEGQQRTYPNGSSFDNLVGIWNDVSLLALPEVRVQDVFVKPLLDQKQLQAEVTLRNDTTLPQTVSLGGEVKPWVNLAWNNLNTADVVTAPEPKWRLDAAVLSIEPQQVTIPANSSANLTLSANVTGQLKTWTPGAPNLYGLVLKTSQGNEVLDSNYTRFGWRQFKIQGKDLLLNGTKIQLTGDFLHPFGPFIGSRRYVWAYYKMIKDVGGNATRPHGQIHPRHYLDLADEMGLCVLDESSIFGSSISLNFKEPGTWERLQKHVDGLVMRDRNHPSVFGWSPANEMFAQFLRVNGADRAAQFPQLQQLALRPRALDPTRDWISVDGDQDLEGVLPTWSRHFGIGVPELPELNKPMMVGEHGGTYYARPEQLAALNGEKSYESYAGRNEALGMDLYRMITEVPKPHLAYFSPSELGWFGLEHLPIGYHTDTRVPSQQDGVFFGPYVEGQPGIQVERMPPYVVTINPGFDPAVPVYKPLAMFDAMKAALATPGADAAKWQISTVTPRKQPPATNTIARAAFLGSRDGALFKSLYLMGTPMMGTAEAANASLLIIDGETISADEAAKAKTLAPAITGRGGMVWVMVRDKGAALPLLKGVLPSEIATTSRQATSLVRGVDTPAINGFNLGDLYFAEASGDRSILKCGLSGPLVQSGRVLLRAANVDWTLFNQRGENEKCSNILIYEHLRKPEGAALVEVPQGTGKLWVSSLDYQPNTPVFRTFWRQLLQNVGLQMGKPPVSEIVQSARDGEGAMWSYITDADNPTFTPPADWFQSEFNDAQWKEGRAGFGVEVPHSHPHTEWHSNNIWLRHEFNLATVPQALTLQIHHDEDVEVYLNGVQIFTEKSHITDYKDITLGPNALKALKVGRNVIAVHCLQTAGGQYIDAGLAQDPVVGGGGKQHDLLLDGPVN